MSEDWITVRELAEWRRAETPHLLVDVREAHELAIAQVEGAVHIPMSQVPARLAELPADTPLVLMCHHGARSQRVVDFLRRSGRANAINLAGGIDAWSREVDPAVETY